MKKDYGTFAIYMDKVKDDTLEGWFMNPYMPERVSFHDLGEMVLKMDDSLHQVMEQEQREEVNDMDTYSKSQFFYLIQILYTRHDSWQGIITGTNQPQTTFKSTVDCIRKINNAMEG